VSTSAVTLGWDVFEVLRAETKRRNTKKLLCKLRQSNN
jgi:hypothetical protein